MMITVHMWWIGVVFLKTSILWNKKIRVEAPQGGMAGLVPPTTTGETPEGDKYQVESDKCKNNREISGKDKNRLSQRWTNILLF